MTEISWLMPLLLLPGIGILLGAAATRHGNFQTEIHHLLQAPEQISALMLSHLRDALLRLKPRSF